MKHLKRYWVLYTLLVVAIIATVYLNWETIKGWFSSEPGSGRLSGSSERKECINYGGGNCSFYGISVACSECSKRGITIVS